MFDYDHKKIHAKTSDSTSYERQLVNALENLFNYIEYLQRIKGEQNGSNRIKSWTR